MTRFCAALRMTFLSKWDFAIAGNVASYAPLSPPQDRRDFSSPVCRTQSVGAALPGTPPGGQNKGREAPASRPHAQHINITKSNSRRNPLFEKNSHPVGRASRPPPLLHPVGRASPPATLSWPRARDQQPAVTDQTGVRFQENHVGWAPPTIFSLVPKLPLGNATFRPSSAWAPPRRGGPACSPSAHL